MDKMRRFWVGADPGGKSRFGLAFVDVSRAGRCEAVSSVDEAVKAITAMGKPLGPQSMSSPLDPMDLGTSQMARGGGASLTFGYRAAGSSASMPTRRFSWLEPVLPQG